jgi:hypothetical protein
MPCSKKRRGKTCDFELLALPSAELELEDGDIHADGHPQHSDHPSTSGTTSE